MNKREVKILIEGFNIVGEAYFPQTRKRSPALCICHGIPSGAPIDPTDKGYQLLAERFCNDGWASVIFNFRGTGVSGGNLDLMGWARDAQAVVNYLRNYPEVDADHISLMGFSGGAATSIYVAAHDPRIASVVACACPTTFALLTEKWQPDLISSHFREIGAIRDEDFPPSLEDWVSGFNKIAPLDWIKSISPRPLLILHGGKDKAVNVEQARELYRIAGEPKDLLVAKDGEHKLRLSQEAMDMAVNWLNVHEPLIAQNQVDTSIC